MIFKQRSLASRASVAATLVAEAVTFWWLSGTIFGRDVVPEVCRINATSSAPTSSLSTGVAGEISC